MSRESRSRFREIMSDMALREGQATPTGLPHELDLPCLLIAAETMPPDGDLEAFLARGQGALDRLAQSVPPGDRDDERLRQALGGFFGQPEDYDALGSSLLPQVVARGRGLPILLSVVWTETARRVGIPAYGVALPGHFVAAVGHPDRSVLVDPWSRGSLLPYDRARDIVERSGNVFRREHLTPARPVDTIARILANIRIWAAHPLRAPTRLWAIDYALELPQPPPGLMRERGHALLDLGHARLAQRWFEEYADVVADAAPAEAESARIAAKRARAMLN